VESTPEFIQLTEVNYVFVLHPSYNDAWVNANLARDGSCPVWRSSIAQ
jgi:hypothetical protein